MLFDPIAHVIYYLTLSLRNSIVGTPKFEETAFVNFQVISNISFIVWHRQPDLSSNLGTFVRTEHGIHKCFHKYGFSGVFSRFGTRELSGGAYHPESN